MAENQGKYAAVLNQAAPATSKAAQSLQQVNSQTSIFGDKIKILGAAFGGYLSVQAAKGFASSASPNGLTSVDKAFNILAGTIGQVVLPYFVAFGGAAMMAATRLQAFIGANLDTVIDTWTTVIEGAIEATQTFADFLSHPGRSTANAAMDLFVGNGPGQRQEGVSPFAGASPQMMAMLQQMGNQAEIDRFLQIRHQANNLDLLPNSQGPSMFPFLKTMAERDKDIRKGEAGMELAQNMRAIVKDMRSSQVQSGINDPVNRWKEVALQIQKSDLDRKMMEMQERSLRLTEKHIQALEDNSRALIEGPKLAVAGP